MIKWLKGLFNNNSNEEGISPSSYFDVVKGKRTEVTDESLDKYYENCMALVSKYEITGQTKAINKLKHLTECIEKEREAIQQGVNTFVYRDDVFEYIEDVAKKVIKVIELENYARDIPDEVFIQYNKVKDIFDEFYVVYTDYTGKEERKEEVSKREKDPILFGAFKKRDENTVFLNDRLYFIGDWEDEYCDLTLEKMTVEYKQEKHRDIQKQVATPEDLEVLKDLLKDDTSKTLKIG